MPYPASTKTLGQWTAEVDQRALLLKSQAEQQKSLSAGGTLTMDTVRRFYDLLKAVHVFYTQAAAVPGIADYIRAEKGSAGLDPVAEFQGMQAAVANTIGWLNANVPQGTFKGAPYKLALSFPADNVTPSSALTFTAADTAGYRTVLDSLIATIG